MLTMQLAFTLVSFHAKLASSIYSRRTAVLTSNRQASASSTIIGSDVCRSIISCSLKCIRDETCDEISYNKKTKVCEMRAGSSGKPSSGAVQHFSFTEGHESCPPTGDELKIGHLGLAGRSTFVCHNGWVIIQNREFMNIDFYQNYQMYVNGFGNVQGDFWWGLERLHDMTSKRPYKLRVEMELQSNGTFYYQEYSSFQVKGASDDYRLSVSGSSGTAGDGMAIHNNMKFSTFDADNDVSSFNCGSRFKGGWWFYDCFGNSGSHLNGPTTACYGNGGRWCIFWLPLESLPIGLRKIRMMIK